MQAALSELLGILLIMRRYFLSIYNALISSCLLLSFANFS
jgi:hypothetical protein